jgi:hypothetical protein
MKDYTVEDIRRLVPEEFRIVLVQMLKPDSRPGFKELGTALLSTRARLEVAMGALKSVSARLTSSVENGGMMPIELEEITGPMTTCHRALAKIKEII